LQDTIPFVVPTTSLFVSASLEYPGLLFASFYNLNIGDIYEVANHRPLPDQQSFRPTIPLEFKSPSSTVAVKNDVRHMPRKYRLLFLVRMNQINDIWQHIKNQLSFIPHFLAYSFINDNASAIQNDAQNCTQRYPMHH
jgi:hypothetical protein